MKAVALISGGLDSILAARFMQSLGIEVMPVYFETPFCHKSKQPGIGKPVDSLASDNLKEGLKKIDISSDFLKLLVSPRYGFGSHMNPCIDCKILMLSKAKAIMQESGAKFVITGEVLGQRPMSQHHKALKLIEEKSGLAGLLLRPLSAKLLDETIPEKNNWVNRQRLLEFNGRSRRPQMKLALELGIKNYSTPAGGCLLTDPSFAKRLKDLIKHREASLDNIRLLKLGRHFRLSPQAKLIVGRNEKENIQIQEMAVKGDYLFFPAPELAGPTSLGRGIFNEELIKLSCAISCYYHDLGQEKRLPIYYQGISEDKQPFPGDPALLMAEPVEQTLLEGLRL